MAGPFKVVYEDEGSRLVEAWSDEAAVAGGWMPLWLSLVGRDSAVKAVGTAIQRGLRVEAEPGAPEELRAVLEYRYVGTPRVRYTRVAGLTHALMTWEHDGWALAAGETEEEALLRALDGVSTLPWEPEWAEEILRAAKDRGERSALLREVGIWSARGFRKAVILLKKNPEEWDLLIQVLVREGRLEIPGGQKRAGRREEVFQNLDAYLRTFGEELGRRIAEEFEPLYDPGRQEPDPLVRELKSPLMRAQADVVTALARALSVERQVILSGEMGVGKTRMGAVIPWLHAGGGNRSGRL